MKEYQSLNFLSFLFTEMINKDNKIESLENQIETAQTQIKINLENQVRIVRKMDSIKDIAFLENITRAITSI